MYSPLAVNFTISRLYSSRSEYYFYLKLSLEKKFALFSFVFDSCSMKIAFIPRVVKACVCVLTRRAKLNDDRESFLMARKKSPRQQRKSKNENKRKKMKRASATYTH